MKVVRKMGDRMLDLFVKKVQAAAAGEHCYCITGRPCGPGGIRSMWCCDRPGQTPNHVCWCAC